VIRQLPITNLMGLENLGSIRDELLIEDNPYLTTLEQLGSGLPDNYRTSIRNINVKNNMQLQNLEGLGCFQNMTGTSEDHAKTFTLDLPVTHFQDKHDRDGGCLFLIGLLAVIGAPNLRNVSGLRNLERVGTLVIALTGLTSIRSVNSLYQADFVIIASNEVSLDSY